MSKLKLLLASMLLVFALGAVAAASASAEEEKPEFVIEKGIEGETDKIAEETKEDIKPLVLEGEGEPTIECKTDKVVGATIVDDSATETIKGLDFGNCVDKSQETCKIVKGEIDTNELEVVLEDGAKAEDTKEKFKPKKEGQPIAEFKLEGTCTEKSAPFKIEGAFTTVEEDHEVTGEKELPVNVNMEAASEELKYGDAVRKAKMKLDLSEHGQKSFGLCRHPHSC